MTIAGGWACHESWPGYLLSFGSLPTLLSGTSPAYLLLCPRNRQGAWLQFLLAPPSVPGHSSHRGPSRHRKGSLKGPYPSDLAPHFRTPLTAGRCIHQSHWLAVGPCQVLSGSGRQHLQALLLYPSNSWLFSGGCSLGRLRASEKRGLFRKSLLSPPDESPSHLTRAGTSARAPGTHCGLGYLPQNA